MQGLMQNRPLALPLLLDHIDGQFAHKTVTTRQVGYVTETSYGELAVRIRRAAAVLDLLQVPARARVGTFAWNTQRHLELYLAVPCSNRVLHTLNHRLFADQLAYIVDDAEDDVLFVERSILDTVWDVIGRRSSVRHVVVIDDGDPAPLPDDPRILDYEELMASVAPAAGEFQIDDDRAAAALCYTSGTTGDPKGVLYDHRSIVVHALSLLTADSFGIRNSDVILPIVPMFHVNAWGLPYAALMCGADLVLPGVQTAPLELIHQLQDHRVTFTAAVATVWRSLLPYLKHHDLSALRQIVCGGGAVPLTLSQSYVEAVGLPLGNAWGMTETSPVVTGARQVVPGDESATEEERTARLSAPGAALPLCRLRIVGEDGEILPEDGESRGELQVAGPTIAGGYFGSRAGRDSFSDDGWLRTGDVATIDPYGHVSIVDRTKDLIKSGGEWISSVELEGVIMADPRVAEAVVIAVPSDQWGERPLACVVPAKGEVVTTDSVREFLATRVARWWIPDEVRVLDSIPKTATGKASKATLREQWSGVDPLVQAPGPAETRDDGARDGDG